MLPATSRGGRQDPLRSKPPSLRQRARPPTPVPESPGLLPANLARSRLSRLPIPFQKAREAAPPKVFRLERGPIVCFLQLTEGF